MHMDPLYEAAAGRMLCSVEQRFVSQLSSVVLSILRTTRSVNGEHFRPSYKSRADDAEPVARYQPRRRSARPTRGGSRSLTRLPNMLPVVARSVQTSRRMWPYDRSPQGAAALH